MADKTPGSKKPTTKKVRKTPSKFMRGTGATPRTPASQEGTSRQRSDMASSVSDRVGSAGGRIEPSPNKFKVPTITLADGRNMQLLIADMSNQALTTIPESLWENHNIGVLDLSANNIHQVPAQVGMLPYLHELHVNNTSIRCRNSHDSEGLSKNLAKLNYLHTLSIQCCNLIYVPPIIWDLRNLTELYLNRNRIYQLPPEVGKLKKLRLLNLQLCGLTTLPPEIAYCQELEELIVYGNQLQSLPETVSELTKLHMLGISYRVFTAANVDVYMENLIQKQQIQSEHVSPVVFQLRSLREMDLSFTKINTFPPHNLQSLSLLDLSNNYIRVFPESITKFLRLRELIFTNNELSELPESMSDLAAHLRRLRLSGNKFEVIPSVIFELVSLKDLDMSRNQISEIPDAICHLAKLKMLNLANNKLRALPDRLCELSQLETLDIRNNNVVEIPGHIHRMDALNSMHAFNGLKRLGLWVLGNPNLATPPPVVWMGDDIGMLCDSVRRLAVQNLAKEQRLNPTRLVLVGENDAVKTEIARKLLGIHFADRGSSVCGIHRWTSSNGVPFVLYDLHTEFSAAQSLTPIFLVQANIVLFAFDFNKLIDTQSTEPSPLEHWLDTITTCAPGAIVKLIAVTAPLEEEAQQPLAEDQPKPPSEHPVTSPYCNQRTKLEFMKYIKRISTGITRFQTEVGDAPEGQSKLPALKRLHELNVRRLADLDELKANESLLRTCREVTLMDSWTNGDRWEELEWQLELLATNSSLTPHVQMTVDRKWHIFGRQLLQKRKPLIDWAEAVQEASAAGVEPEQLFDALHFLESCGMICRYVPGRWLVVRPQMLMNAIEPIVGPVPILDELVLKHRTRFPSDKLELALELFKEKGSLCEPLLKSAIFYSTAAKLTSMKGAEKMLEDFGLGYVRNDTDYQGKSHLQSWFTTSIVQMTRQVMVDGERDDEADGETVLLETWPEATQREGVVQQVIDLWPVVCSQAGLRRLFQLFQVRLHQNAWLFMQPTPLTIAAEVRQADSEFAKAYVIAALQKDTRCLRVTVRAQDELFISWALDIVANIVSELYSLYPGILLSGINYYP